MNASDRLRLLNEVRLAGNCSHPVRLSGEVVDLATGEVRSRGLLVACKDRRQVVCPSCSALYKADAWILVSTGLEGGKDVPVSVSTHPRLFVTLTAPSFGQVHTISSDGSCVRSDLKTAAVRTASQVTSPCDAIDPVPLDASDGARGRSSSRSQLGAARPALTGALFSATNDAANDAANGAYNCALASAQSRAATNAQLHAHRCFMKLGQCFTHHDHDDPNLGHPLCPTCYDYVGAVIWNATVSKLWNNTVQWIRRLLAEASGLSQVNLRQVAQVHYLKVAELQRRGLVHMHVVIRLDGSGGPDDAVPEWMSSALLTSVVKEAVRRAVAVAPNGVICRWGTVMDLRQLPLEGEDARKVASYLAKYSTKTTDGSRELAHRFHSRRQIRTQVDDLHARRMAETTWDLASQAELSGLHLRDHAHTFGFTGQLITKSRGYSTTFTRLRQVRAEYMAGANSEGAISGTFAFDGRGYSDERASDLAECFFTMNRELRRESAQRRRAAEGSRA